MTDSLKRLAGPVALGTSAATIYTAPALTTATLRTLHVANETASAAAVTVSLGADGAGKRLLKAVSVPGNGVLTLSTTVVLAAGELLQAYADTGSALTLTASGVETT